jgi:hypothetical protein
MISGAMGHALPFNEWCPLYDFRELLEQLDLASELGLMPDRFENVNPNDLRFQFEIIRQLAESVRGQSAVMADMQKTQVNMIERLARIEANRTNEDVARIEATMKSGFERMDALSKSTAEKHELAVSTACGRIDKLEADKDRRDGAIGVWSWLGKNWPFAAISTMLAGFVAWANGKIHI